MERLNVDLADRSYPISIGSGLLGHRELFSHAICGRRVMVVSNETVAPLLGAVAAEPGWLSD